MAFGFAIRYVGYSLTYALAVGLSAVLGFFLTPLIQGTLGEITSSPGTRRFVTFAIGVLVVSILVIGYGNHLNHAPAGHG